MSAQLRASLHIPEFRLTKLAPGRQPTFPYLLQLQGELVQPARQVPTKYSPATGAASAVLSQARWNTYFPNDNRVAPDQAPIPPVIQGNANQRAQAEQDYADGTENYNIHKNICNLARAALEDAVPTYFYSHLRQGQQGFSNVAPWEIMDAMFGTYGTRTRQDRTANLERMKKPYNPAEPPETVFAQITEGAAAQEDYAPLNDLQKMDMALNLIEATGKFKTAIEDFQQQQAAQRTWANLQRSMSTYWSDNQHSMQTAQGAGYANQATQETTTIPEGAIIIKGDNSNTYGFYCHTHGFLFGNGKHQSKDCKSKSTYHDDNATLFDLRGGNALAQRAPRAPAYPPYQYQVPVRKRRRTQDDQDDPTDSNLNGNNNNNNRNGGRRQRQRGGANLVAGPVPPPQPGPDS